jgi:hypothetical protein
MARLSVVERSLVPAILNPRTVAKEMGQVDPRVSRNAPESLAELVEALALGDDSRLDRKSLGVGVVAAAGGDKAVDDALVSLDDVNQTSDDGRVSPDLGQFNVDVMTA